MAQGPLTLPNNLPMIPRHPEKLLSNFDLDKKTKAEYHIDDDYMHLWMLEVKHDDISSRIFHFTLEGGAVAPYHILPVNLVHTWREFKNLFLEKISNDKTPTMLLKDLRNSKMGEKEKVKYSKQTSNRVLNKFPPGKMNLVI